MPSVMSDDTTQIALLAQKIDGLFSLVGTNHGEIKALMLDHETRLRDLERSTTEISARLTMLTMIQSAFTAVASGVAALIGRSN